MILIKNNDCKLHLNVVNQREKLRPKNSLPNAMHYSNLPLGATPLCLKYNRWLYFFFVCGKIYNRTILVNNSLSRTWPKCSKLSAKQQPTANIQHPTAKSQEPRAKNQQQINWEQRTRHCISSRVSYPCSI